MSLTSYRAAPPRGTCFVCLLLAVSRYFWRILRVYLVRQKPAFFERAFWPRLGRCIDVSYLEKVFVVKRISFGCVLQAWQRPTLPHLEMKYHWRWGV